MSVVTLLTRAAEDAPDHVALAVHRDGDWVKWTYEKYLGKYYSLHTVCTKYSNNIFGSGNSLEKWVY